MRRLFPSNNPNYSLSSGRDQPQSILVCNQQQTTRQPRIPGSGFPPYPYYRIVYLQPNGHSTLPPQSNSTIGPQITDCTCTERFLNASTRPIAECSLLDAARNSIATQKKFGCPKFNNIGDTLDRNLLEQEGPRGSVSRASSAIKLSKKKKCRKKVKSSSDESEYVDSDESVGCVEKEIRRGVNPAIGYVDVACSCINLDSPYVFRAVDVINKGTSLCSISAEPKKGQTEDRKNKNQKQGSNYRKLSKKEKKLQKVRQKESDSELSSNESRKSIRKKRGKCKKSVLVKDSRTGESFSKIVRDDYSSETEQEKKSMKDTKSKGIRSSSKASTKSAKKESKSENVKLDKKLRSSGSTSADKSKCLKMKRDKRDKSSKSGKSSKCSSSSRLDSSCSKTSRSSNTSKCSKLLDKYENKSVKNKHAKGGMDFNPRQSRKSAFETISRESLVLPDLLSEIEICICQTSSSECNEMANKLRAGAGGKFCRSKTSKIPIPIKRCTKKF